MRKEGMEKPGLGAQRADKVVVGGKVLGMNYFQPPTAQVALISTAPTARRVAYFRGKAGSSFHASGTGN